MRDYRDIAKEFIETLRRENGESQKRIDEFETTGTRIRDRLHDLKREISSRNRTIARLEEELRGMTC